MSSDSRLTNGSKTAHPDADGFIPNNASIEIIEIEEDIIGHDAKLHVTLDIYPAPYYGNPLYIYISLKKEDGKWLIYDMQ